MARALVLCKNRAFPKGLVSQVVARRTSLFLGTEWQLTTRGKRNSERGVSCSAHWEDMRGTQLIACIGDVHGYWTKESEDALSWLQPDLSLFVGDFGEEDIGIVSQIASVPERKQVILGNHDGWYSTNGRGSMEGVEEQLDLLGNDHVGLSANSLPDLGLSVVGCRPFSAGGRDWKRFKKFYERMYGLRNFEDSTTQIVASALAEPKYHDLVFLSHNGPSGLGDQADSICGVDWKAGGFREDYGDIDMQDAIDDVIQKGRRIPLVVFGHMHEKLHRNALPKTQRKMFHLDDFNGVAYVNCAVVPRIRQLEEGGSVQHNFVLVKLSEGEVEHVESVWVEKKGDSFCMAERIQWYCAAKQQDYDVPSSTTNNTMTSQ